MGNGPLRDAMSGSVRNKFALVLISLRSMSREYYARWLPILFER